MKLRVEARSIETAPEFGEPKGDGVAVLLEAHNHNLIGCPSFKRNGPGFAIPDAQFGANIRDPNSANGVLIVPL